MSSQQNLFTHETSSWGSKKMWGIKWLEAYPTSYQTTLSSVQLSLSNIMPIFEYYTKTPAGRKMVNTLVAETRRKLASGADLGTAIRADGIFPLALVQVFTLGQNTGDLGNGWTVIGIRQISSFCDQLNSAVQPCCQHYAKNPAVWGWPQGSLKTTL